MGVCEDRCLPMGRYVALLRGINVGGNNPIGMSALKACFEAQGLGDVVTYIQSGNVLFSASGRGAPALARTLEDAIAARFGCRVSVFLRTREQLRAVVERAPPGFGARPAAYRYDVIFLARALTAAAVMKTVPTAPGIDQTHAGTGVLYFSRLMSKASRSRIRTLISMPVYKDMTIRNWNTTTALLRLMGVSSAP
jgi:uncharacterized protein (DUF1697 family)